MLAGCDVFETEDAADERRSFGPVQNRDTAARRRDATDERRQRRGRGVEHLV